MVGEGDMKGGLMDRLEKVEKKEKKVYKQIDKKTFKTIVFGYFAEGFLKRPRAILKRMRGKYKVDGEKIELGDILGLKQKYIDEYGDGPGRDERDKQSSLSPPPTPQGEERSMLMQLYDDAKAKKDEVLMKRIQDRLLGKEEVEKSLEQRVIDTQLRKLENIGDDSRDSGNFEYQQQLQKMMLSQMKFNQEMMEQMANNHGGRLSTDPSVALAQVVAPTFEKGFEEVNETIREVGGLSPKKKKLTEEEQKKVQDAQKVLLQFQEINKHYSRCDDCGFVIPKVASQCPRCGAIFAPSEEEKRQAEEYLKKHGKPPVEPLTPEQIEAMRKPPVSQPPKPPVSPKREEFEGVQMDKSTFPNDFEWLKEWFEPDGKLSRLKYKIERKHDAQKCMAGAWAWVDPESGEDKKLLFVATKGMDYILDAAKPYIDKFNQKECYEFFNTAEAKIWMQVAFDHIKKLAKEDGVVLTEDDIKKFESQIKPYIKKDIPCKAPCALCGELIDLNEMNVHIQKCSDEQLKKLEEDEKRKLEEAKKKQEKK